MHLLKLSDGKPHPRAKNPLLEYEIPLTPTERGWELGVVIWENKLGCLFTSTLHNELVDILVVWDWTSGDLVRVRTAPQTHPFGGLLSLQVLPQCGNRAFIFLNDNTIVAGRATESARPSLSFFDLSSDERSIAPYLILALPDEGGETDGSLRIRLNLGIPIHHGPELQVHLPFVVNPSQQILFAFVFFMDPDGDLVAKPHSITIPLSILRGWARADASHVEWDEWRHSSVGVLIHDPGRASFTMGSRFVSPDIGAVIEAVIDAQPLFTTKISIPLHVYNLSPYRWMRAGWESSGPHCRGISGVWNTVAPIHEDGSYCRAIQILAEPTSDILMTEDSLIVVELVRPWAMFHRPSSGGTNPINYRVFRTAPSSRSRSCPFNHFWFPCGRCRGHRHMYTA